MTSVRVSIPFYGFVRDGWSWWWWWVCVCFGALFFCLLCWLVYAANG